jgi:hypothetical protein
VHARVVVLAVALASGDKSDQGQCFVRLFRYLNDLLAVRAEVVSRNAYIGGLERYFDISRVRHHRQDLQRHNNSIKKPFAHSIFMEHSWSICVDDKK